MNSGFETSAAIAFVLGALMAVLVTALLFQLRIWRLRSEHAGEIATATKRSLNQSRSTLKGQIGEQLAPLLPGFAYEAADARFLGDPIDYVVFDGRAQFGGDEEDGEGLEIVLLEIKYGESKLSPVQRAIAEAVEAGRVRFEICRISENGSLTTATWEPTRRRTREAGI
jgi:predicted Holliday junction resolvase-like endonuclease